MLLENQQTLQNSVKPHGAIAPLGTKTKSSPPPDQKSELPHREKLQELRSKRYELLASARSIYCQQGASQGLQFVQNYHRTAKCKYVPTGSLVGVHASQKHHSAFYTGLVSCGSVWTCAVCAVKIQERRRLEIEKAINFGYANGLQSVLVTLTFPHYKMHRLSELLIKQADALARLRKGKQWDLFKNDINFQGLIRALELTYGENGWHPHTHELWFVDKNATLDDLIKTVKNKWWVACLKAGLVKLSDKNKFYEYAVDIKMNCSTGDYLAKQDSSKHWGADREMAKASSKIGKSSGLHPFAFLTEEHKDSDKWIEFTKAIKGKSQLFWSRGLKDKFNIEEKTDEQLAEEENDEADLLGMLTLDQWKLIRQHNKRTHILDIVENSKSLEFAWRDIKLLLFNLKKLE